MYFPFSIYVIMIIIIIFRIGTTFYFVNNIRQAILLFILNLYNIKFMA